MSLKREPSLNAHLKNSVNPVNLFSPVRTVVLGLMFLLLCMNLGCATHGKTIAFGMSAGAVVGAGVGSQFYYKNDRSIQTQNAIIGAGIVGFLVGGFLSWHYRSVEREVEMVSGQFAPLDFVILMVTVRCLVSKVRQGAGCVRFIVLLLNR